MKQSIFLWGVILSLAAGFADSEEKPTDVGQFVCVSEQTTGFHFKKSAKAWTPESYSQTDRYLVFLGDGKVPGWEIRLLDKPNQHLAFCRGTQFNQYGELHCGGFMEFKMNRYTGRFVAAYLSGYWNDDLMDSATEARYKNDPYASLADELKGIKYPYSGIRKEGDNTPYLQIGTCTEIKK